MNRHDADRIAGALEGEGWLCAESEEEADCIILLTCCVRESAERRLYGRLASMKSLKERRPISIAVGGCIAQKEGERMLVDVPHVDLVFGTHQYPNIASLIERASDSQVCAIDLDGLDLAGGSLFRGEAFRAWVTITHGCRNYCSYCIVPYVRGDEISRDMEEVAQEVGRHIMGGAREINLLGQNVNSYRLREEGISRFSQLLDLLGHRFRDTWIRFTTSHPRDFDSDIINAIAENRNICEHVHLPLQAGSDRVLENMNRGYTASQYMKKVKELRARVADVSLTTDLIVGFPGETEEDFQRTLDVVEGAAFDASFTFIYNSRPGTAAAAMRDDLAKEVKQERLERLMSLTSKLTADSLRREVGREMSVMVTGPSRRDPGRWAARSHNNKIVHFEREREDLTGKVVRVAITEAGNWSLKAMALEAIG